MNILAKKTVHDYDYLLPFLWKKGLYYPVHQLVHDNPLEHHYTRKDRYMQMCITRSKY